MTAGDFIPTDGPDVAPEYPTVFGIPLTPTVKGVLCALFGLGASAYVVLNLVQPAWDRYQELNTQVEQKRLELEGRQKLESDIQKAQAELETAKRQKARVESLFSNQTTLKTVLLDINRLIEARNEGLAAAKAAKLRSCPAWVRNNLKQVEDRVGALKTEARLGKFEPNSQRSGLITDGSYGTSVNNTLGREVANVSFEGNFDQTRLILRDLERLQPLLVVKNLRITAGDNRNQGSGRLYEIRPNGIVFLENCQPETKLTTTFDLEALRPPTPKELEALKPAQPPPAQ